MQSSLVALAIVAVLVGGCSGGMRAPSRSFSREPAPETAGTVAVINDEQPSETAAPVDPVLAPGTAPPLATDARDCGATVQRAQRMPRPVDIIFGVDTTGSMGEEIAFTEENMNEFSKQIASAGVDARVTLISGLKDGMQPIPIYLDGVCIAAPLGAGQCPADARPPGYVHVPQALADWDILQQYIDLYPMYQPYLRESSFKTFVSISDGDIAGNPVGQQPVHSADTFIAAVEQLEPASRMWESWRYSAIYSFSSCGVGNQVGATHAELVQRTHGVAGDLCLQDFKPVFDELAKQVTLVATLACDWVIPSPPTGESFDTEKTNVRLTLDGQPEQLSKAQGAAGCGSREGWHYDDEGAPRRVVACPATCARIQAAREAEASVLYGCETIVLPD